MHSTVCLGEKEKTGMYMETISYTKLKHFNILIIKLYYCLSPEASIVTKRFRVQDFCEKLRVNNLIALLQF